MTSERATRLFLWLSALAMLAGLAVLPGSPGRAADEPDPEPAGPFPRTVRAHRTVSANNLKQIALAFHNFHDTFGAMPAHAIHSKTGKPLLSWRVALLPFLDEDKLFKEFRLDEPWDSKHNKKLLARLPAVFAPTISGKPAKPGHTYYRVFTGANAPFNPKLVRGAGLASLGPRIVNFTDGTSNTILVIEAGEPVPWTKPDELVYDEKKKLPRLGGLFPEGFHVALADGSTRFIGRKMEEKVLRALITPSGGEEVDWGKAPPPKPPLGKR